MSSRRRWGHKVTVVIYVPGGEEHAERAAELAVESTLSLSSFAGVVVITPVEDEPRDQG